mgnify:CR=1 FL=1
MIPAEIYGSSTGWGKPRASGDDPLLDRVTELKGM